MVGTKRQAAEKIAETAQKNRSVFCKPSLVRGDAD
jgi:hypothetical protein